MLRIYVNLLKPVLDRLGVAGAGALVTWGADKDTATQFMTALISLLLLGVDLVLSFRRRKSSSSTREGA